MDQMIAHAEKEKPNECCGVLLGTDREVIRVRPCINIEGSPCHYNVALDEILRISHEVFENGWEILGVYHSHPETEAYPSLNDIRLATYPNASYVIVSLAAEPIIRSFQIRDGIVREERINGFLEGV